MKCTKCGAYHFDNESCCEYCGSALENSDLISDSTMYAEEKPSFLNFAAGLVFAVSTLCFILFSAGM